MRSSLPARSRRQPRAQSSRPGSSGSPTPGASFQAPPRSLISRWVGRTVRAVANISACDFRRIGRPKYLETLDCGTLAGSGPICCCALDEKSPKGRAGLNTTEAFRRWCESGLILRKTLPSSISKATGDDSARRPAPHRSRPEGIAEGRMEQACRPAAHVIRSSRSSQPNQAAQR